MLKARHLVNGDTVLRQPCDDTEYTQILLDRHHAVFADGIATEATPIEPREKPSLPAELLDKLPGLIPGRKGSKQDDFDVQQMLLSRPDAFDLLLRASMQ